MLIDQTKWPVLDGTLHDYMGELPAGDRNNLLAYTMALHRAWRSVLQMLNVPNDWSVLDVGTGYGLLAFELCGQAPMQVLGIDIEPDLIEGARELGLRLADIDYFVPDSSIRFEVGDIMGLPAEDAAFDFTVVREVLQFLPDPESAVAELIRVTRPGGYLCLSDLDDQLYLTYPGPSPAFARLNAALVAVQERRGGDRHIGRKLSALLRQQGCTIASVVVIPEAQHLLVDAQTFERELVIAQFAAARERVVEAQLLSALEFDAALDAVREEPPVEQFRTNSRIVVIGSAPAG